jgi:hypothetical protein
VGRERLCRKRVRSRGATTPIAAKVFKGYAAKKFELLGSMASLGDFKGIYDGWHVGKRGKEVNRCHGDHEFPPFPESIDLSLISQTLVLLIR